MRVSGLYTPLVDYFKIPYSTRASLAITGLLGSKIGFSNITQAIRVNGLTDTALATAITNASATTSKIVVLDKVVVLAANVTVPADITIVSFGKGSISGGGSGTFGLIVSNRSCIAGVKFISSWVQLLTTSGQTGIKIIGNQFLNSVGSGAIRDGLTSDNTLHNDISILCNEFNGCAYGAYLQRIRNSRAAFNYYKNVAATGRGIFFVGGESNLVEYNYVDGAIVGIGALVDRRYSRGFISNVIRRNFVTNVSEEGISIDTYGNSSVAMTVMDRCLISGTSGSDTSNPSVVINRTTTANIVAGTMSFSVLTGPLAGRMFPITFVTAVSAGVTIRLQFPSNSITAAEFAQLTGNHISIEITVTDNSIIENEVTATTTPIALWGIGHGTMIHRNITRHNGSGRSISVSSLGGLTSDVNDAANANTLIANVSEVSMVDNDVNAAPSFNSVAFSADTNTLPYTDPQPSTIGGNAIDPVVLTWIRVDPTFGYVSAEASAVLTSSGEVYTPPSRYTLPSDLGNSGALNKRNSSNGTSTQSGTGAAVAFNIPHLLGYVPNSYSVTPASSAAATDQWVTADATNLIVNYAVAPATGTNNLTWKWSASLE